MKFRIPFTFSRIETLKRKVAGISNLFHSKNSKLESYLKNSDIKLRSEEYLGICLRTFIIAFIVLSIIFILPLFFLKVKFWYIYGIILSLIFSLFVFFKQINYPKSYISSKTRDTEKDLIPSLQDMFVQLQSGVPLFQIIENIANSDYGSVSYEFKTSVAEINSGVPQIEALEDLIKRYLVSKTT